MKCSLTLILFLINSFSLFGQQKVNGIVIDKESGEPVPYLNIGIENTSTGTISEQDGYFELLIPDSLARKPVTFYGLGYEISRIKIPTVLSSKRISLQKKQVMLNEVNIRAAAEYKSQKLEVNRSDSGKGRIAVSSPEASGAAVAIKFNNPHRLSWITNAAVMVSSNNLDTIKIRVRIMEVEEDGTPGKDLLNTNVISRSTKKRGWIDFDLSNEFISVPGGPFFLTFELLEELEVRKATALKREKKTRMILELYEKGVDNIEVFQDTVRGVVKQRWRHSLSLRQMKKHGIDFSTESSTFSIVSSSGYESYARSSSFDPWKRLIGKDDNNLKASVTLEFVPEDENAGPDE